eukprot:g2578.t1
MNSQSRKVAPKGVSGRKLSSTGGLGLGPRMPVRSSSTISKRLLQSGVLDRLRAEETKTLQSLLNEVLENCTAVSKGNLAKFLESKVDLNELWQDTYGTPWNPTEENLKLLSQHFLQVCMAYIRAESTGRPDPKTVMRRFVVSVVTDICELLSLVNIGLCFHWKQVSAGWILSGCVVFERILQTIVCMTLERKSFTSMIASLLGVKTFLTSYLITCLGLLTAVEGSKIDLFTTRLFHKGFNAIFVSAPQVVLNSYMIFSKLNKESEIDIKIQIQIFFILAVSFSCGLSLTNLVQEHQRQRSNIGYYKSITQIHPANGDEFGIIITKTCWNIVHFMMVTSGLGALIAKAPSALWISLVLGFFVVLNLLRCIINEGEIRFYKRMNLSSFATTTWTMVFMIMSVLGVGLMPLSVLRWHNVLSPIVFGVGWISSFLISSVSLLYFSSSVILWVAFSCLCFFYIIAVYVYFQLLKPGAWKTFVWSKENWKNKLRNEWWENTYNSDVWEDIHLIGHKDAHYAGMILLYLDTDLPWDKLTAWLKEKKTTFRNTPPTWLTVEWLVSLPKKVIADVWNIAEYRDLLDQIREVEDKFALTISAKRALPVFELGAAPSKSIGTQNTNMKPKKYFNQGTKTKIHPKSESTLKNDLVEDSNISNTKLDKDLAKLKVPAKTENALNKSSVGDQNLITKEEDAVTEKTGNGTNSEVMPEKDQDESPNILSNNDPGEERVTEEDERTKAIRKEVVKNMRKRSSFGYSVRKAEEEDIPSALKELFRNAETMKMDEIREASKEAVDGELFAILLGPEKDATGEHIMLTILKGFLGQRKKQVEKKSINEGVPRILLAAFFELFDEVSDIILAGLFYADTDNKRWAGHLMFAFMGLNRLMQGLFSLSCGESKWRVCEGFIGIKCITDTYRMIRDGPLAQSGGQTLVTVRAFSLGIGMTCESLPQMMLQVFIVLSAFKNKNFETGILIAQATSVMFSCISIGLSLASVYVDSALAFAIPGKEIHKSCYKFLPRDDKFRQTVILVSMTMIKASHLLLAIFGFGALFSYAPIPG